jgi:ParB family chromosome partitioning protein
MTNASETIAFIALNKLIPWNGNVRKTGASDGIEELQASISAHGVLQSLVVRKNSRGKFAVVAGRRRYLALSALAEAGSITADTLVPCRVVSRSADATEISLAENVVRAPMHPADQFEAFRDLIDAGSSPADVAARFGITEAAVRKRLTLARVSPVVFTAYRADELTLEQVQAFTVSDDHAAQERVLTELSEWNDDPSSIRSALTQDDIEATDKRARFVTLDSYEKAGGAVRRDLFAEDDDGVFLLDPELLERLAREKLEDAAQAIRAEGWKWVEARPDFDYGARCEFERRYPEATPLSEEDAEEQSRLSQEYESLYEELKEGDEETSARLDAIEARIAELEDRERVYSLGTLELAGAVVTIAGDGKLEILRGLVRPEDAPREEKPEKPSANGHSGFSATLTEDLTAQKSAAISASLMTHVDIALAAVVHAMASSVFFSATRTDSLQISARRTRLPKDCKGSEALAQAYDEWSQRIACCEGGLWEWCLAQDQGMLLQLLAFCAACTVNAVQLKHDRDDCPRLAHANAIGKALKLDMTQWFTPTAENFFNRVPRTMILSSLSEAGTQVKRSWEKLRKPDLAVIAAREAANARWLPQLLKA